MSTVPVAKTVRCVDGCGRTFTLRRTFRGRDAAARAEAWRAHPVRCLSCWRSSLGAATTGGVSA